MAGEEADTRDTEDHRGVGARRRRILAVAIGAIALDTALLGLIAPLLPEIERRTGASESGLGLALAAYSLPILLVAVPLGRAADSVGRRPLLLGGLMLTVAGSLLIAASESLGLLVAGRAVQGIGSAASWVAALAIVADLALPGRKGEAIGFALAANSGGAIAGPALGGIIGGSVGFEAPFLIVAWLGSVLIAAGWVLLPRPAEAREEGPPAWGTIVGVVRAPGVLPAALISVGGAAALGLIEVVVPLDLDRRLGLTAVEIGLLFAGTIALDATAAPIAGRAGDRLGRPPVAVFGLVVLSSCGLPLALIDGIGGAIVGLGLFGVGVSTCFAAVVPWLDDAFGELNRGLAYGGLNLVYSVGYAAGPLLAGGALELATADVAYAMLGVGALAGALLLGLGGLRGIGAERRDEGRPPA
jgi:predicted MFS family arabinose efflux permease